MLKGRSNPPPHEQDIKSRIVFQAPQANLVPSYAARSFSSYKQQSSPDIPKVKLQSDARTDRPANLTIDNIKRKYGFISKAPANMDKPLQPISNRQKGVEAPKPTISDLKVKYQTKKPSMPSMLGDSENESIILDKYKVDKKPPKELSLNYQEWLKQAPAVSTANLSMPRPPSSTKVPPELSSDATHKKLPSSNSDITPNFSDQMKTRNKEWLENLDRVQDRIRAVLER